MTLLAQAIASEGGDRKADVAGRLLAWYDGHHRELPWRVTPGQRARGVTADPYRVWLSEIMLQQTTVEAVKPYFRDFLARWPTVEALAAAGPDEVMKAWAGLGYYSRARNLKKCADFVAQRLGGRFPDTEAGLLALPGVGPYTAAAIAAIAFDRPAAVVDGNVERVISRLFAISTPLPEAKRQIRDIVAGLVPDRRPGDFAQAMMDLGATICSPKRPRCLLCPVKEDCCGLAGGDPQVFPVKAERQAKPLRTGAAFVAARRTDGAVLLARRPDSGLLGGMTGPPTTGWTARVDGATTADAAPFAAEWRPRGVITHVFTHFELRLHVFLAEVTPLDAPHGMFWSGPQDLPGEALPTVMKKAIEAALPGATRRPPSRQDS